MLPASEHGPGTCSPLQHDFGLWTSEPRACDADQDSVVTHVPTSHGQELRDTAEDPSSAVSSPSPQLLPLSSSPSAPPLSPAPQPHPSAPPLSPAPQPRPSAPPLSPAPQLVPSQRLERCSETFLGTAERREGQRERRPFLVMGATGGSSSIKECVVVRSLHQRQTLQNALDWDREPPAEGDRLSYCRLWQ
ncbi:unnamed protein product [Gadus morhua 'NCC']